MPEGNAPLSGHYERIDPIEGTVASRTPAMTADEARAVADKAAAAFKSWSKVGPTERRMLLLRAADQLEARSEELVKVMMLETGAAAAWGGFNVHLAAKMLREAGSVTTQITGEVIPSDRPGVLAMGLRQPAGVSLGIAPWNAPIILATRAVAVPLACGNTVVLKGSEACPHTHTLLAEIIASAGFPEGVVNIVTNAPQDAPGVVEALILHPAVRRVNFTGSTHVGRIIGRLCGEALKPVLLELGGKSPLIVLDDADLDLAVKAAAFGAFMNSGQICMSTERIIVDEKVADEFVRRLSDKAASLPVGNPRTEQVVLGSCISQEAVDKVQGLIADATGKGAVLAGGAADKTFMAAAVLDRVTPDMKIYHDESFGPVVSVVRVKGDEEAIRVANDTEYGLSAAVITANVARGIKVARQIESGICHINGPTVQDEAQMPFGGVKASGVGRFGGRWGIEAFTDTRWVSIETEEPHFPF
jgi:acyl-CoA reductase-like NAD-dependent aldehyde dehydrogenase